MRKRWQVLAAIASFGVMGFFGAIARFGFHPNVWVLSGLGGFVVACGLPLWAAITDYRQKWPAAVALVAIAPFAQRMFSVFKEVDTGWMVRQMDLLGFQIIACSIFTVVAAIVILLMKIPPPVDSIARAQIR